MAEYRLDSIASLAQQMTFTPSAALALQLTSAEALVHDIDPAKAYPLEFVIFRITGYRPKDAPADLLTGLALQHDLGLLIERLSEVLDISTTDLAEPVLSIDDVTERFNVTSKTIHRWRRRGLPARRFMFPDGKRRVGFLLSSVERFFSHHRDQIPRGLNLAQVDDLETQRIIRRARLLAREGGCWEAEICRRIARTMNRSSGTILHTIRKFDQEHGILEAILPWAPLEVPAENRARILRAHRHGTPISELAQRHHQTRSAIYRVIMDERIARLNRRKIKFIDDPLYHEDDAAGAIDAILSQEEIAQAATREETRVPPDLPAYLQELYRTPLLTPSRERALFLKFNFYKFQFVQARRKLEPQFARSCNLDQMERYLRASIDTKNQIVRANLRLVVSVARKHLRPGLNLMELISDGNVTLMRAVESYDAHRGNRFSTYATLALMKGFARSVPLMQASRRIASMGEPMLSDVPDARNQLDSERLAHRDEVRQLMTRLDERERTVLLSHYGLSDDDRSTPQTYEELSQRLGLSKQRVRQIELTAIEKLRAGSR